MGVNCLDTLFYKLCGCTILTHGLVMTAAHCIEGSQAADIRITVGTNYLSPVVATNHSSSTSNLAVAGIRVHPSYNPAKNWDHDFALLELEANLTFTKAVAP